MVNQTVAITGEFFEQATDSVLIRVQEEENYDTPGTVLLELKIDFAQKKVFRNHFQNGAWGTHEDSGPFPFAAGELFDLSITPTETAFVVRVDYEPVWTFDFRTPLTAAKYIVAKGALNIEGITLIGKRCGGEFL